MAQHTIRAFSTTNPVLINSLIYLTDVNAAEYAASYITRCLANNDFTAYGQLLLMNLIHDTAGQYKLQVTRSNDDHVYLTALKPLANVKFKLVLDIALLLINGLAHLHHPRTVINGSLATALYTNVLQYRCKITNDSRISKKVFLM